MPLLERTADCTQLVDSLERLAVPAEHQFLVPAQIPLLNVLDDFLNTRLPFEPQAVGSAVAGAVGAHAELTGIGAAVGDIHVQGIAHFIGNGHNCLSLSVM